MNDKLRTIFLIVETTDEGLQIALDWQNTPERAGDVVEALESSNESFGELTISRYGIESEAINRDDIGGAIE